MNRRPTVFWIDVGLKVLLIALLLFGTFSGLERFEGKAFAGRLLAYPLAAAIVPVAWLVLARRRGRRPAYPYLVDMLLVLPFVIDTAGNALDLYDTVEWWDDANHFVNWAILTGAFGAALARVPLGRLNTFALALGFGALTAVLWEFAEYVTFIRNSPELDTAYTDTLGDLALGISGAAIASVLAASLRPAA